MGVNKFQAAGEEQIPILRVDDSIRVIQTKKLQTLRASRDNAKVDQCLQALNDKANSGDNIMPAVVEAVENKLTLGEIADELRGVFGEYK